MKSGFSIVELLIGIAIIGILVATIMPAINLAREKAKIARVQLELKQIRDAIIQFEADTQEYPGHLSLSGTPEAWDLSPDTIGLTATDGSFVNWKGPYIVRISNDQWGHAYFVDLDYDVDKTIGTDIQAVVGSYGPNGVGQNEQDTDNIFLRLVD
jgi:prepilin-type N-terminal cleavage/methylation domain-containing protein